MQQKEGDIEKDRQFFCSELIAKAFKVLGVLRNPDSLSCASYVPGSFSPGGLIDS